MKAVILATVAIVAGVATGMFYTHLEFSEPYSAEPRLVNPDPDADLRSQPRLEVLEELTYNFGVMDRNEEREKVWSFKNVGDDLLTLEFGSVSCSMCVQCDIETPEVAPGETGRVRLTWSPKVFQADFHHGAEIMTNDPAKGIVRLQIEGRVTRSVGFEPLEITFNDLSPRIAEEFSILIFSYRRDDLEVELTGFEEEENAKYFDVRLAPLAEADLQQHEDAKSGYLAAVTLKPGLPVGPVSQTILLSTNDETVSDITIPVRGTVASDVSLLARNATFSAKRSLLTLGAVPRASGDKAELYVMVRGEQKDDVQVTVGEVDPNDVLKASIGEPRKLETVTMHPLTIEIPAGGRLVSRMGYKGASVGKVVIETTHPDAKQVLVLVRFAVAD